MNHAHAFAAGDAGHATAAPLTRVSFPTPYFRRSFRLAVLPCSLAVVGRSPPGTRSHRDRFYAPSLHRPVSWHVTRHPPPDTPRRRGRLATSFAGINPLHSPAGVNCDCVTECRSFDASPRLISFFRFFFFFAFFSTIERNKWVTEQLNKITLSLPFLIRLLRKFSKNR